ncbi:hypothetical protein DXT76_13705 [Halobacillus trueperi]|uniref:Uncharacterized protein n=1 Tax=Halobacillus trueperi TaxID=156205 RepID=A0A3D8VLU6_9BACI|nr:hypothetical protein [Halobacillus trueperi]RDY70320.1 hypothetical protein DXT76_13705 [Halobacillus trueperi]
MRNAIREKLMNSIPEFKDVYEPHVAGPQSEKPYGVIRQGVDTEDNEWAGFRRIVEIWPYVSRTTFTKVDDLQKKIIEALDQQLITNQATGAVFSCVYLGTAGQDVTDHEWDAITRGLRFAVMAVHQVEEDPEVSQDAWVSALSDWSEQQLNEQESGQAWSFYENRLPLGYQRPSVLWRISNHRATSTGKAGFLIDKEVVGHVISESPDLRMSAVSLLVEQLVSDIKIPLDITSRKYMTVVQPRGDFLADGLNRGQITLRLTRRAKRLTEEAPVINEAQGREI